MNTQLRLVFIGLALLVSSCQGAGTHSRVLEGNTDGNQASVCSRTPSIKEILEEKTYIPCDELTHRKLATIKDIGQDVFVPEKILSIGDFDHLSQLRELKISGLEVPLLPQAIFSPLKALKRLDLGDSLVAEVSPQDVGAVLGLESLTLGSDDKPVQKINKGTFEKMTLLRQMLVFFLDIPENRAGLEKSPIMKSGSCMFSSSSLAGVTALQCGN